MNADNEQADDVAAMSLETALGELESIVDKLEGGAAGLEESIKLYERGERLKARCETLLKQAEARIDKITIGADGKAQGTEPMKAD